jgi:hypothetical protein
MRVGDVRPTGPCDLQIFGCLTTAYCTKGKSYIERRLTDAICCVWERGFPGPCPMRGMLFHTMTLNATSRGDH